MGHERVPASAVPTAADQLDGTSESGAVPLRYRRVCAQMRAWGVPDDLARLGLVMRRVERGSLAPSDLNRSFGAQARAAAAALAAFGHAPRPSLQHAERA